jgi:hypothetical protein
MMRYTIALIVSAVAFGQNADLVLRNGKIVTLNPAAPAAQAVAIRDDRILAVGSNADAQRWITYGRSRQESFGIMGRFCRDDAARRKPPVPHAGSEICIIGLGRITSTLARMTGRGVKYCPAPPLTSSAFLARSPS